MDLDGDSVITLFIDISVIMPCIFRALICFMFALSDILGISIVVDSEMAVSFGAPGVMARPAAACKTSSGRQRTRPRPLASILSTHDGNAPVLMYLAKIVSESSCVQSLSSTFAACRSASRRRALSLLSRAKLSNGRVRDAAGRMSKGPRMASL